MELGEVFWYNDGEPLLRLFYLDQLKNLKVVVVDLTGKWEWANVDDIDIRILDSEESGNLGVLFLLIFFNRHSLPLIDGERIDMDLYPLLVSSFTPLIDKVLLHLLPNLKLVLLQLC